MSETKYKTFRDLRSVSKDPPKEETLTQPSSTSISSISSKPRSTSTSIAPERDFQRVPNSVTREAMPQGLFRGKSKQVYDYLYHQTRGAMSPKRSVRKSRKEILKGSGLGSMVTVDAAVEHLKNIGLLDVRAAVGSLNGNEYEVFTPEECSTRSSSSTSTTSLTQNLDNLDVPESSSTSTTQPVEHTTSYGFPKTKIKDKEYIDDDARAGRLSAKLSVAERELTGKTSMSDDKWDELAEVLITELKIAAARTTVSNVPAFLAEHLRRRLWKVDKERAVAIASESDQGGQTPALSNEERRNCPDCAGTGFWYPQGPDKGVAKCKHLKLRSTPLEQENA